jgi:predicted short-subunit dehydrogenase-like oxidoreductase (DUF2520 family)
MIGFIGAGNVGTTLGMYFHKMNMSISGYTSRTYISAKKSASKTNSKTFENIENLIISSKYIMITTPDDAIEDVVADIIMTNINLNNKVICHTSGAHPSSVLDPLYQKGATIASLHPILSFADIEHALSLLHHTPFTLEGKGNIINEFIQLLEDNKLKIYNIKTKQKTLYHASACIVSNYLVTLMDTGVQMLNMIGFDSKTSLELIEPLVKGTLNNIFEKGPESALSGPIARGDISTIQKHIEVLSKQSKDINNIYSVLGNKTLDIVMRKNTLDENTVNNLREILKNEKNND